MTEFFLIVVGAGLVNNLLLHHLLGVCPGVALSRRIDVALDFGAACVAALGLASLLAYPMFHYLLEPLGLAHLELIALVFLIMTVIHLAGAAIGRLRPALYERFRLFVPLLLVNCSVVGAAMLGVREDHGVVGSLAFGVGAGLGLALVLLLLAALEDRLDGADVPAAFRGAPVHLLTLAILSLAFMGFTGLDAP